MLKDWKHWLLNHLKNKPWLGRVIATIAIILLVMFAVRVWLIGNRLQSLEQFQEQVLYEVGDVKMKTSIVGNDLQQVRSLLRLPSQSLDATSELPLSPADSEDAIKAGLTHLIQSLGEDKLYRARIDKHWNWLTNLQQTKALHQLLVDLNLQRGPLKEDEYELQFSVFSNAGEQLMRYSLQKDNGHLYQVTDSERFKLEPRNEADLTASVFEFIHDYGGSLQEQKRWLQLQQSHLENMLFERRIANLLEIRDLSVAEPERQQGKIYYYLVSQTGEPVGNIVLDSVNQNIILLNGTQEVEIVELLEAPMLLSYISELDVRSFVERATSTSQTVLQQLLEEPGMRQMMETYKATLELQSENDESAVYNLVIEDTVLKRILIDKTTGQLTITEPDGTNERNLLFSHTPTAQEKNNDKVLPFTASLLPVASAADTDMTILLVGQHQGLADTIVLAHINEVSQEVRMVSLPRDLYVNGGKINRYGHFGMPQLKEAVERVSGVSIDEYVAVDMYAFKDLVDAIGGIEVTLETALVDPSYRTVEEGKVGTLFYPVGKHQLDGTAALRLARSRYTSSDFDRSSRQQLLIQAIGQRVRTIGFASVASATQLINTVLTKLDTSFTTQEAIALGFRAKEYEVKDMSVASSRNVLYSPPYMKRELCLEQRSAAECASVANFYHLLPRGDWSTLHKFVQEGLGV